MPERSRLRELIDRFAISGHDKAEIDGLLTDLERSAKAMGAYEAGRDHAPAIAQLVETNTRLEEWRKRVQSAIREALRALRDVQESGDVDPEEVGGEINRVEHMLLGCLPPGETWPIPAVTGPASDNSSFRNPASPPDGRCTAWTREGGERCTNAVVPGKSLCAEPHLFEQPAGGPDQDRGAAALRPADRCVGFEPHPWAIYADEFCVAPVYEAKPGEVARPRFCGRPRSEHEMKP